MKKYLLITGGYIIIYAVLEILSRAMVNNIVLIHAVIITLAVIIVAFAVEKLFFKETFGKILQKLGFVLPVNKSLGASIIISIVLMVFYPVISMMTGYEFIFPDNWISLQIGVFLVHGIAEELLYRGFLFRHLRETGLTFWKAGFVSVIFFAAAHLQMIGTMGILVGGTAFLLAAISSFPLAYLYERGGNSILPPAIVHFAIDTIIPFLAAGKPGSESMMTSVYWMVLCMIIPYLGFILLRGFKTNLIHSRESI